MSTSVYLGLPRPGSVYPVYRVDTRQTEVNWTDPLSTGGLNAVNPAERQTVTCVSRPGPSTGTSDWSTWRRTAVRARMVIGNTGELQDGGAYVSLLVLNAVAVGAFIPFFEGLNGKVNAGKLDACETRVGTDHWARYRTGSEDQVPFFGKARLCRNRVLPGSAFFPVPSVKQGAEAVERYGGSLRNKWYLVVQKQKESRY
ncbi:hypothetical protein C8R44DRAFT_851026 [Mycena epipterygia]|nr:hypothetical protein C8R44DRAFT_851026 [Mycena epipterygia]